MAGELEYWAAQVVALANIQPCCFCLCGRSIKLGCIPCMGRGRAVVGHSVQHCCQNRFAGMARPPAAAAGAEHGHCSRQGRAPLPYALSELIDNALRATQDVRGRRRIAITFATAGGTGAAASGLIAVWDNGARGHALVMGARCGLQGAALRRMLSGILGSCC